MDEAIETLTQSSDTKSRHIVNQLDYKIKN